jgi:hypothetical protein
VQRGVARHRQKNLVGAATDFGLPLETAFLLPETEARMALDLLREVADELVGPR